MLHTETKQLINNDTTTTDHDLKRLEWKFSTEIFKVRHPQRSTQGYGNQPEQVNLPGAGGHEEPLSSQPEGEGKGMSW